MRRSRRGRRPPASCARDGVERQEPCAALRSGRSAFGRLPYTAQHTAWRCATSVPSIHTDGPCVSTGYVELHAHSNYSFLDGASDVEELVTAAVERGMDALALTDTNGLYGAVRFWNAAKDAGIRPLYGAEIQTLDFGHLVLIARDRIGWRSLCRTISAAQLAG
ncbi:MAG: PHP domain-containing protein, partial [Chloroflexi bacterium]